MDRTAVHAAATRRDEHTFTESAKCATPFARAITDGARACSTLGIALAIDDGMSATHRKASLPSRAREIDVDDLEDVSGGLSFSGLLGTAGGGVRLGVFGGGVGGAVAPAGPNEGGALYGGYEVGAQQYGWGVTGGATVGGVFTRDGQHFDDVVTGPSHNVSFGLGQVSWNDSGFYVGVGPSGFGYSRSNTTRLTEPTDPAPHAPLNPGDGRDHSNDPAPQLNDWSTAYGPNEGGPALAGNDGNGGYDPYGSGPTQHFDDGSSLTHFDDGSTLARGTDGSFSSTPATDDGYGSGGGSYSGSDGYSSGPTQHFDDGSSLTTYDDGSTLAQGSDGSYSATESTDTSYDGGNGGGGSEE